MSGAINYNYLAEDPTRSISDTIGKWQGVQKNALDIQNQQAQVEQGKALQAAIDPATGQFDQARYNQLLATNPRAARGALAAAQGGVTLDTATYNLHTARMSQANDAIGSLIGRYPNGIPQDAAHAAIDQEVSTGLITPEIGGQLKTQFGTDLRQNSIVATQLYSHNMNTQQQLDRMYGTRQAVTDPSGTQFVTVSPPGPNQPNVVVPAGMGSGAAGAQVQWQDAQGVTHYGTQAQYQQARGVDPRIGPQTPVLTPPPTTPQQPGSNAPPPPPGNSTIRSPGAYVTPGGNAPTSTGTSAGGKVAPPGPQSQNVPPAGAVSSDVAAIQGGMQAAQNTPSGTVPGAVAAAGPAAGTSAAAPAYTDTTGPPASFGEQLKNDIKTRTDASLAAGDQRKNLQAGENAFEALKLAGNYTGAGTGTAAALYSWLEARAPQFVVPQGTMTETAWRQVLAKNLLRFAQESGLRMNTDLGMSEALKGTANADTILPNANREILINDIGMARQRLAQTQLMPPPSGDGAVVKHFQTYTSDTDPRAFAWDLYSGDERKAIEAEVAKDKSGKAEKRLDKGLEDAAKVGLIKLPGQSQAAPPPSSGPAATSGPVAAAAPNALLAASSGGPPNALAA